MMSDMDGDAKGRKMPCEGGLASIGSCDPKPSFNENFRQSAHADPADSDKMNRLVLIAPIDVQRKPPVFR